MKKILSLLTVVTLTTSATTSVVSCNKQTYVSVTKQQETNALQNFITNAKKDNKLDPGFNIRAGYFDKQSSFNNQKVINNIQKIHWTVTSSDNSTKDTLHNMLKASYSGIMDYNVKNKKFILEDHPFNKVNYIPGNFSTSLGTDSIITGDSNDFTIGVTSDQLTRLVAGITGSVSDIKGLFKFMWWNNLNNFSNLKLSDLYNILRKSPVWEIPDGYMAILHIKNLGTITNKNYQVVWSNLNTPSEKKSLNIFAGCLANTIWKKSINQENLWISKDLLTLIYQLKENNLNKFLINKASFFSWLNLSNGIQITKNSQTSNLYNTNKDELWNCIQNSSLTSNQNTINNLIKENYTSYNLIFNKNATNWVFDKDKSKGLLK